MLLLKCCTNMSSNLESLAVATGLEWSIFIPIPKKSNTKECSNYHIIALISHMILYMFQCHSPKSSHPHPLPRTPKDCSIHLCLSCCLTYRVIITIFLNFIYMCQYTVLVFFFLAYFTLYNRLQFHPSHQN